MSNIRKRFSKISIDTKGRFVGTIERHRISIVAVAGEQGLWECDVMNSDMITIVDEYQLAAPHIDAVIEWCLTKAKIKVL
jgi:hypothetical protein